MDKVIKLNKAQTEYTNIKCPICKKKALKKNFPFCSNKCSEKDLSKWISGNYYIPENKETFED